MDENTELHRRIRELEGDLSNARHDLQAVHALHERLRQAEWQRDEAWKRIDELEAERRRDGADGQAALDEAGNRILELEGAVRSARLEIEGVIRERDELRNQVAALRLLVPDYSNIDVTAAAQAHDARVRAEGRREGLRQAVAFLREEADRREPHAEADALRAAADALEVEVQREEGDPFDTPEYAAFVQSMAKDCHCTDGPCDGVLAGGPCDEIVREEWE